MGTGDLVEQVVIVFAELLLDALLGDQQHLDPGGGLAFVQIGHQDGQFQMVGIIEFQLEVPGLGGIFGQQGQDAFAVFQLRGDDFPPFRARRHAGVVPDAEAQALELADQGDDPIDVVMGVADEDIGLVPVVDGAAVLVKVDGHGVAPFCF